MAGPRYREEAAGLTPEAAHGSRARALASIGVDVTALEGRTAADVPYTPTTSADWVAPAPTTVLAALDRLAAAGGVTPVP